MLTLTRLAGTIAHAVRQAYTSEVGYSTGLQVMLVLIAVLWVLVLALLYGPADTPVDEVARQLCAQRDPWCPPGAPGR
jgi:hypothetical protein